ncbi:MAG TPA: hypothetical protein VGG33_26065 [Polyangia bacterium]
MTKGEAGDEGDFRVIAILAPGRSGTTLLRNELLKPAEVTCLSSEGTFRWFEANRALLCGDDSEALRRAHPSLARQWHTVGFASEDLKPQFAASPAPSALTHKLLVKLPMFRFGAEGRGRFRHVDVIRLFRDPLAIVESMCRPQVWNDGQPFWAGPRAPLLGERTADLGAFAKAEGVAFLPHTPEQITALPYHVACATWLADYLAIDDELRTQPGFCARATDVAFEDFLADREGQLQRLAAFMGVQRPDYPPNRVYYRPVEGEGGIASNQDTGEGGRGRRTAVLTEVQRSEVAAVLAEVRARRGYGASPRA